MTSADLITKEGKIVYTYRGGVERGIGGRYEWRNGYSATTNSGGVLYPWLTTREAQRQARETFKAKAVFVHA